MFNGEKNHFLKLFFCLLKTSDILPFNIWNFNMGLSQWWWINAAHGEFEMLLSDGHCLKNLCINFLGFNINDIHLFSNTLKSRFSAKSCNVSPNKTMSIFGNCLQINVLCEFHIFGMDSQYFKSSDFIRNTDIDLSIKSSKSSQSWIKRVGSVCSSNYNNVSSSF